VRRPAREQRAEIALDGATQARLQITRIERVVSSCCVSEPAGLDEVRWTLRGRFAQS
jgi:hypothetical protein